MPVLEGPIRKMKTDLLDTVSYRLPVGDQMLELNPLIGKEIAFSFEGVIACIACGRKNQEEFQSRALLSLLQAPRILRSVHHQT